MFGLRCDILAEFQETIAELKLHTILNSTLLGGVTYPKGLTFHMCLRWGDDGQKEFNCWMGTIALIYLLTRPVHSHEMLHVYLKFPNIGGAATNTCIDKLNLSKMSMVYEPNLHTYTHTNKHHLTHTTSVTRCQPNWPSNLHFVLCWWQTNLWQWWVGTIGQFLGNRQCYEGFLK